MKKLVFLVLLLTAAAAGAAVFAWSRLSQPYQGYAGGEQFVEIPAGAGTAAIGRRLVDAGIIRDATTYRLALWLSGDARRLKAGEYRFDRPLTVREVIATMVSGDVYQIQVTFREGLTIAEMAQVFAERQLGEAGDFVAAARDVEMIRTLDPAARDLEGYLFPDTYALPRKTDAPRLVRMMVERFRKAAPEALIARAAASGLTARQLVTLASIVEKETAKAEERPLVAAVYRNRLEIGMPLQCDPTVIYALQRARRFDGNLRRDDLMFDSPYNTYRYPGLPPGPIAAPGRAALEAVAAPADVDYLYFVSRNDGSHAFARTLDEHNRNVQRFQIQYFRERRAAR